MSRGSWSWEAQSVVIYDVWRFLGGPDSATLTWRVGPLKEPWSSEVGDPGVRGLERLESGSDECLVDIGSGKLNVSRMSVGSCLGLQVGGSEVYSQHARPAMGRRIFNIQYLIFNRQYVIFSV